MVSILRGIIVALEQELSTKTFPEPIHPADDEGDDGVFHGPASGDSDAIRLHRARYYLEHRYYCALANRPPMDPPDWLADRVDSLMAARIRTPLGGRFLRRPSASALGDLARFPERMFDWEIRRQSLVFVWEALTRKHVRVAFTRCRLRSVFGASP